MVRCRIEFFNALHFYIQSMLGGEKIKCQRVLTLFSLILTFSTQAQITIHNNSQFKVKGQLTTNASLLNTSTNINLEEGEITLMGSNKQITTNQDIAVDKLVVDNTGVTIVNGNWKITNSLSLVNGILQVGDNARLFYTGSSAAEGTSASYVEGYLFQSGEGRKFFPIGAGGIYLPAILENVPAGTIEVGMRAVKGDANLALPQGLNTALATHYWELSPMIASRVSLSLVNVDQTKPENLVVWQASTPGGTATSVSNTLEIGNDFITSNENVAQPILTIGSSFLLIIHDMITPFTKDEVNDNLIIENIEETTSNKVVLLDRWGVKVKEWTNFTNEALDDFSELSPGNYICIIDFVSSNGSRGTQKGIITVLKTK